MKQNAVTIGRQAAGNRLQPLPVRVTAGIVADHMLVADQDDADVGIAAHLACRLDGDLRADAVRIADRERDRFPAPAHNGNASNVSMRELSQITIRSRIFGAPPFTAITSM